MMLQKGFSLKLLFLKIALNFALGSVIALFIHASREHDRFLTTWYVSQITTHLISMLSSGGIIGIYYLSGRKELWFKPLFLGALLVFFSTLGLFFAAAIASALFSKEAPTVIDFMQRFMAPSVVLALAIGYFIAPRVRKLWEVSEPISNQEGPIQSNMLVIRHDHKLYQIPISDILYIAAKANKAIIFTQEREYEASDSLKKILEKLPSNQYLRVHKSYVLNLEKLSHIEYNVAGSYFAYLYDDQDLTVPVGRAFAPKLKQYLGNSIST